MEKTTIQKGKKNPGLWKLKSGLIKQQMIQ